MGESPLEVSRVGSVFRLTLDTPGSAINVFDRRAADGLVRAVAQIDPARDRVLLLESRKPGSFVNGVGLMLANAVQETADAARLTRETRLAYQALREAPIPTIAAIAGSCFGCGVELSLQCDYRVASDDWETCFYMTELADYLFVPCFGGTRELPWRLGLRRAADLLLRGERWSGFQAESHGLVDACLPSDGFAARALAWAKDRPDAKPPRPRRADPDAEPVITEVRRWIERLPPVERACHSEALDCMALAARGARAEDALAAAELDACGRTVRHPASKAAQAYFFIGQMASVRARLGAPEAAGWELELRELAPLADAFAGRVGPRSRSIDGGESSSATPRGFHRVVLANRPGAGVDAVVRSAASDGTVEQMPSAPPGPVIVHLPLQGPPAYAEVSHRPDEASRAASVCAALERFGVKTIRLPHAPEPLAVGLGRALLGPLDAYVREGGDPTRVLATTRALGFRRAPSTTASLLGWHTLAERLATDENTVEGASENGASPDPDLADAVAASLIAFADSVVPDVIGHPSTLDAAARLVLDFPLSHCSLCRFATPQRAAELHARCDRMRPWVGEDVLRRLERHARRTHGFYR